MTSEERQAAHDLKVKFKESPIFEHVNVLSEGGWQSWIESGRDYSKIGLEGQDTVFEPTGRWDYKEYVCKHVNKVALRHTEADTEIDGKKAIAHTHTIYDADGQALATASTNVVYSGGRWKRIERIRRDKMFELLEVAGVYFGHTTELNIIFDAFVLQKLAYISSGADGNGDSSLKTAFLTKKDEASPLGDALRVESNNPEHGGMLLWQVITFIL